MIGYPLRSRDEEKRKLRCHLEGLKRANEAHKEARKRMDKQNRELKRQVKELERKVKQLEEDKDTLRRQRDQFRNMIFKPNINIELEGEDKGQEDDLRRLRQKNKRGQKEGHKGSGRSNPKHIDCVKRIYLKQCPICDNRIKRSKKIKTHIVEDIPSLDKVKAEVTCYEMEEGWCGRCKKWVRAKPYGVIPKSRLGINLLLYAMIQKYGAKSSWQSIVFMLEAYFNIKVSQGALVGMMHRARDWLGPYYDKILTEIRKSRVKHADETQWRIDGINHWLWGFFTKREAYYTVEESRGKGVAEENLKYSHPEDVLVRDDYGGYKKLPLKHQSCWAHLLRVSKEAASDPKASEEAKKLHEHLKNTYKELSDILEMPFNKEERSKYFAIYSRKITDIIYTIYKAKDAKEVKTRIVNQNKNLITALNYEDVPLTNNLAERCIRPFVIARKMSGGSRSHEGAKTQAVNMSIFQTTKMRNLPLIPTLKEYLLSECIKN